MASVRLARTMGFGASLYPKDATIEDVPLDLLRAISHANKILDWHENLMTKDIPPEWMWGFDDLLGDWFDEIKAERDNPEDADDRTVVPLMENELAQGRGR